jgi:hypothetical protein
VPSPALQLSGEVTGLAPTASLAVVARVGEEIFPATVSGHSYIVNLGRPGPGEMVVLEASSERVHYRSFAGSAQRLRSLGGSDALVVLSEHSSLRISPYSSALAWQVAVALGGRDAASDAEFDQALRSAASDELGTIAYVLAAIAMNDLSLPPGYATGQSLLQNRSAFREFSTRPGVAAAAKSYLFYQDDVSPVASDAELGNSLVFLSGLPYHELPLEADVHLLERQSNGSFNFHQSQPLRQPNYSLAIDGSGAVELRPEGAASRTFERPTAKGTQLLLRTSTGHTLRRLTQGVGVGLWALQSRWTDLDLWDSALPEPSTEYKVVTSTSLEALARPTGWSGLLSNVEWVHPWLCVSPVGAFRVEQLDVCDYVRHDFRYNGFNQTGTTLGHAWSMDLQGNPVAAQGGRLFQWSRDGGSRLTTTGDRVRTDFWRMNMGGTVAVPILFLSQVTSGEAEGSTMVGLNLSLLSPLNSPLQLQPLGEWSQGNIQSSPPRYVGYDAYFILSRFADGTGLSRTFFEGVQTQWASPWQVFAGGFYDNRHWATSAGVGSPPVEVDSCIAAMSVGAASCTTQSRYFRPIVATRGGYYGIEERYQINRAAAGTGQPPIKVARTLVRSSYQTCLSGPCLATLQPPPMVSPALPMAATGRSIQARPLGAGQPSRSTRSSLPVARRRSER